MLHYFFHLYNGMGLTRDEEGRELPSLEAALEVAVVAIRSVMAEDLKDGLIDLCGRIEIADKSSRVRAVVPFRDAVRIKTED